MKLTKTIRLEPELIEAIEEHAEREESGFNRIVSSILAEHVQSYRSPEKMLSDIKRDVKAIRKKFNK